VIGGADDRRPTGLLKPYAYHAQKILSSREVPPGDLPDSGSRSERNRVAVIGIMTGGIMTRRGTLAILPKAGHDTVDRLDAVMRPVIAFPGAHLPATPSA
jgi:hypothetical protein